MVFCATLVGNCNKCIKNEVWKVWLQKELILVGFWLSQVRRIGFFCLGNKIGESVKLWFFVQPWSVIVTNALKMRCQKFGCKRNWSWLGFGLAKFGGLALFALVAKLVNRWSYGFCAILVGNCHKCIKNEVWKVWLQKELILVGFWLTKFGGLGFFALVTKLVNKWSYGF